MTPPTNAAAQELVLVLDFGSQYSQLIARRVREANVYCELVPGTTPWPELAARRPRALILSGGPASVYDEGSPQLDEGALEAGLPVLGICYGCNLIARDLGGEVVPSRLREYGAAELLIDDPGALLRGLEGPLPIWMSHGDQVLRLPPGFANHGRTANAPFAAFADHEQRIWGIQFHPEVVHTRDGAAILRNFLFDIAGLHGTWTARSVVEEATERIQAQVGTGRVICALSGGVDSAVTATLVHRAVGDQLTCVFVDNGLLRRGEAEMVLEVLHDNLDIAIRHAPAAGRFLSALAGVTDPERKRKVIGAEFIEVFEEEARALGDIDYLAQGTLYPDVIESTAKDTAESAVVIKSHHNVGGLPEDLRFQLVEPLRFLFKDEVRRVGLELGLPDEMVHRQPFPGPGLAIRCLGEVTRERLEILRAADWIVQEEVGAAGLSRELWQAFAVLTPLQTVGVMGDYRTYANVAAIRMVTSEDGMTADWARVPHALLARISGRITNEVRGVNRVVYDITSKPPGTIEWE